MIKKIRKTGKYFAPQNEGRIHQCDHPGCTAQGEYRAPKDKHLKEYYWFCLEHVQAYNAKWDYYDDPDREESASKENKRHFGDFRSRVRYQFGYDFIDELGLDAMESPNDWRERIYFNEKDREYASVLETNIQDLTMESLKKQYKTLVKKYHPDVNAGDKACEEKFKRITTAYKELSAKLKKYDKRP
jgi:hypothetical protein